VGFSSRIEHIADPTGMAVAVGEGDDLVADGDGRKVEVAKSALGRKVGRDVILVQALLDGDDGAGFLVVQAAEEGFVDEPLGLGAVLSV